MLKISFFSYKGGAGRSSAAYNSIPFIAENLNATSEHPLIVADMDVDSAGMSFLLNDDGKDNEMDYYSVDKMLSSTIPGSADNPEKRKIRDQPFFSHLKPVGNKFGLEDNLSILFIRAIPGETINSYDRVSHTMDKAIELCERYGCVGFIMDTPAGDQLTATSSIEYSSKIVCCMRITNQFVFGTLDYLCRKDNEFDSKTIILVPNAVPQETIKVGILEYNEERIRGRLLNGLDTISSEIKNNSIDLSMVEGDEFGIPEVRRFKVEEAILYRLKSLQPDEACALERYKKLADAICR